MKPNEGRLQSAEHILGKILEDRFSDLVMGISKFKEDEALLEVTSSADLREADIKEIEEKVNEVIKRELPVHKPILKREEAEKEVDLRKVPSFVKEVTIIDIEGFDKRPCRDPHVNNTKEIGNFKLVNIERVGNNRYRFVFKVE